MHSRVAFDGEVHQYQLLAFNAEESGKWEQWCCEKRISTDSDFVMVRNPHLLILMYRAQLRDYFDVNLRKIHLLNTISH